MLRIDVNILCQILDHGDEKYLGIEKKNTKFITKQKQKMLLTYNHTEYVIYLTFQIEDENNAFYSFYAYNQADFLIKNNIDNASLFIKEDNGWE
jgi:hypothetical protein